MSRNNSCKNDLCKTQGYHKPFRLWRMSCPSFFPIYYYTSASLNSVISLPTPTFFSPINWHLFGKSKQSKQTKWTPPGRPYIDWLKDQIKQLTSCIMMETHSLPFHPPLSQHQPLILHLSHSHFPYNHNIVMTKKERAKKREKRIIKKEKKIKNDNTSKDRKKPPI